MIAAANQQSFRAEQTGVFFLLRSCEVAGLRRRGISLRCVHLGAASCGFRKGAVFDLEVFWDFTVVFSEIF